MIVLSNRPVSILDIAPKMLFANTCCRIWLGLWIILAGATALGQPTDSDIDTTSIEQRYLRLIQNESDTASVQRYQYKLALFLMSRAEDSISQANPTQTSLKQFDLTVSKAISLLNELSLQNHSAPKDAVWYNLAKAYDFQGKKDAAFHALERLAQSHPTSQYIQEVHFRLAEYYYNQSDYAAAIPLYQSAVTGISPKIRRNATYMLGWSQLKNQRYKDAAENFILLLSENPTEYTLKDIRHTTDNINHDSLRALSYCIDQSNDRTTMASILDLIFDKPFETIVYEYLTTYFLTKNRITDTDNLLWSYIKRHPNTEQSFHFAQQSIQLFKKQGFESAFIDRQKEILSQFHNNELFLSLISGSQRNSIQKQLSNNALSLAEYYYQKSKDKTSIKEAIVWNEYFVNHFPNSPHKEQALNVLADLFVKSGDNWRAYDIYKEIAALNPTAFNGTSTQQSSAHRATRLAYQLALNSSNNTDRSPNSDWVDQFILFISMKNEQLPPAQSWYERRLESAFHLISQGNDTRQIEPLLLGETQDAMKEQEWRLAITWAQLFKRLDNVPTVPDKNRPLTEFQLTVMMAQSYFKLNQYAQASQSYDKSLIQYRQLTEEQAANSNVSKKDIQQQKTKNDFLWVKNITEDDSEKRDNLYRQLKDQTHYRDIQEYAYLQLIQQHIDSEQWHDMESLVDEFSTAFPNHNAIASFRFQLAEHYQEMDDWEQYAHQLLNLHAITKDIDSKRTVTWRLASLYHRIEHTEKAIEWNRTYAHTFKTPQSLNFEAQQRLQKLYLVKSDHTKRKYWLKAIVSTEVENSDQDSRVKTILANANLTLADYAYQTFLDHDIKEPIAQSFLKKKQLMEQAIQQYRTALAFNIEDVATAATFKLAAMYQHLSDAMLSAPIPSELSDLEKEEYTILLEEQAFPFEEKAIDLYSQNTQLTQKGHYTPAIKHSFDRLKQLLPARYNKQEMSKDYIPRNSEL